MKKELKTLKDLNIFEDIANVDCVHLYELKAEAIKWVKEDLETIENISNGLVVSADYFTKKWMKRLDITEKDLK